MTRCSKIGTVDVDALKTRRWIYGARNPVPSPGRTTDDCTRVPFGFSPRSRSGDRRRRPRNRFRTRPFLPPNSRRPASDGHRRSRLGTTQPCSTGPAVMIIRLRRLGADETPVADENGRKRPPPAAWPPRRSGRDGRCTGSRARA